MSFASEIRPKVFEDVKGQEVAVRMLRNLLALDGVGRHVLLHGTIGSGKTTLARIYGKALNCLQPAVSRSPCLTCHSCKNEEEFFTEIDAAGKNAMAKIREAYEARVQSNCRIVFVDEVHALDRNKADFDTLLKMVEEPKHNTVFVLATTEKERVPRALQSRFIPIKIKRLDTMAAVSVVERALKKRGQPYDDDAVTLISKLGDGYPRDLISMIEVLGDRHTRLTRQLVLSTLDLEIERPLLDFFFSLADGDLDRQLDLFNAWNEAPIDKARWIQCLVHKLCYRARGARLEVDPVIDAIPTTSLIEVLNRFRQRLAPPNDRQWQSFWSDLLDVWLATAPETTDDAVLLRLTRFLQRCNEGSGLPKPSVVTSQGLEGADLPDHEATAFLPRPALPADVLKRTPRKMQVDPAFLGLEDVRRVVNASSFLGQHYGARFNAYINIGLSVADEPKQHSLLMAFLEELEAFSRCSPSRIFAWIATKKLFQNGFFAEAAIHIPDPQSGQRGPGYEEVREWAKAWLEREFRQGLGTHQSFDLLDRPEATVKRHWGHTFRLINGVSEWVVDWDPQTGQWLPIRDLLRIPGPKYDARKILQPPVIETSRLLSEQEMNAQCKNRMTALSAFDARKWRSITKGWEWIEYSDRQKKIKERKDSLLKLAFELRARGDQAEAELRAMTESWSWRPEDRERSYILGW